MSKYFWILSSGMRISCFCFLDSVASFLPNDSNQNRLVRKIALAPQESFSGSAPIRVAREACCKTLFTSSGVLDFSIGSRPAARAFFASSMVSFASMP